MTTDTKAPLFTIFTQRPIMRAHCGQCNWLLVTSKDEPPKLCCQNSHCPQYRTPFVRPDTMAASATPEARFL